MLRGIRNISTRIQRHSNFMACSTASSPTSSLTQTSQVDSSHSGQPEFEYDPIDLSTTIEWRLFLMEQILNCTNPALTPALRATLLCPPSQQCIRECLEKGEIPPEHSNLRREIEQHVRHFDAQQQVPHNMGYDMDHIRSRTHMVPNITEEFTIPEVKTFLQRLRALAKIEKLRDSKVVNNWNMLFIGNAGVGKVATAGLVAKVLQEEGVLQNNRSNNVVALRAVDIVECLQSQGAKSLKELFDYCTGKVLYVDEAHQLVSIPLAGTTPEHQAPTVMDLLVSEMERRIATGSTTLGQNTQRQVPVVMILGVYPASLKSLSRVIAGISSRYPFRLEFEEASPERLAQMMRWMVGRKGLRMSPEVDSHLPALLSQVSTRIDAREGNWHMINKVLTQAAQHQAQRVAEAMSSIPETPIEEVAQITAGDVADSSADATQNAGESNQLTEQQEGETQERLQTELLLPADFRGFRTDEETPEDVIAEMDQLIGQPGPKSFTRALMAQASLLVEKQNRGLPTMENDSLHMVFKGTAGTGKTIFASLLARLLKSLKILKNGQFIKASRQDLVGKYLGQTAHITTDLVYSAMGGVLFIDEAYSLVTDTNVDSYGMEALTALMEAMEVHRHDLVVILAGYPDEMEKIVGSNPGLRSRISHYVNFNKYSVPDLVAIAKSMLDTQHYLLNADTEKQLTNYILKLNTSLNGNARQARNLVSKIILCQNLRLTHGGLSGLEEDDLKRITTADIEKAAGLFAAQDLPTQKSLSVDDHSAYII
eukprot:TRINITY_DN68188_c10_g4_i1.p1 TRINITY_DN68188_c10_g4~~TRINITY_DN68188_c10_g4_i1.p1  ORF type:complete len:767 (+),score=43.76 TRINITY_DN68188_c10_g4_i1:44-2344(+)